MLRVVGRSLRSAVLPAAQCQQQGFRAFGAAAHDDHHDEPTYTEIPTVFDRLVNITVVDLNGKRHAIKGLTGTTLSQALIEAGFPKVHLHAHRMQSVHQCPYKRWTLMRSNCLPADLLLPQHGLLHPAHRELGTCHIFKIFTSGRAFCNKINIGFVFAGRCPRLHPQGPVVRSRKHGLAWGAHALTMHLYVLSIIYNAQQAQRRQWVPSTTTKSHYLDCLWWC